MFDFNDFMQSTVEPEKTMFSDGHHEVIITEAKIITTKDGIPKALIEFTSTSNPSEVHQEWLALAGCSPKQARYSANVIGKIAKASHKDAMTQIKEENGLGCLIDKIIKITTKIEPSNNGYEARNRIIDFSPSNPNDIKVHNKPKDIDLPF